MKAEYMFAIGSQSKYDPHRLSEDGSSTSPVMTRHEMLADSRGDMLNPTCFVSLRRFFTTVAIHQLAKQGYLSISDPVRSDFRHAMHVQQHQASLLMHLPLTATCLPRDITPHDNHPYRHWPNRSAVSVVGRIRSARMSPLPGPFANPQ